MSEWRPEEGWENPYNDGSCDCRQGAEGTAYEAGADAMLAALKGKTHEETRLTGNPHIDGEWVYVEMRAADIKGWSVVFIPDAPREELALIGGHDG